MGTAQSCGNRVKLCHALCLLCLTFRFSFTIAPVVYWFNLYIVVYRLTDLYWLIVDSLLFGESV